MSGVVLRCPSCGTTQGHVGECEACYEAQVRYFCENHAPGLWLEEPQCRTCGARYGEAPKKPVTPPRAASASAPARAPTAPPGLGGRRLGRPRAAPSADRPEAPVPPDMAELLRTVLGGRAGERYGETLPRARPTVPRARLGGCLGRLMLLLFIMFVFMLMGSFSLLQFFFGGW